MMTFSASPAGLWTAAAVAAAAAGILCALEWRRPDRRHRAARLGATVATVLTLALLGLHPAWHPPRTPAGADGGIVAALWTPGASAGAADPGIAHRYRFALPDAAAAPAEATVLPDAATLRRRYPEIAMLHVFGDGLDVGGLDALRGVRVVFHPAPGVAGAAIRFLHCPRTLPLGEPLVIEGEVGGIAPGAIPTLSLETPDGTRTEATGRPAGREGRADFTLRAAAPTAPGRFLWRVRLMLSSGAGREAEVESLGVAAVLPALPRVLVLESSPHFDTADLRRWFAGAGGKLTARTLVGQNRYRFASSTAGSPTEFSAVHARLLANADLVLADAAALAALTPPERDALLAAVTGTGLGVLTLGDDAPPPIPPIPALFPWQLAPEAGAAQDDGEHLERPAWTGQTDPIAEPIPAAPFLLAPLAGQTDLIRDGQDRTLAAAVSRGRGQLALTLLRDTGRWLRGNDPAAFSAYWSYLFSRLARPLGDGRDPGRWTLAAGDGGPIFAGQPATLLWSGTAAADAVARVAAESGAPQDGAVLALARDPAEPNRRRGTFWPRRAGWYTVSAPAGGAGASLDFFVDDAAHWPALAAGRRRMATARFAEESASAAPPVFSPAPERKGDMAAPAACFFALFVAGAGFLWSERRLTG